jgi:hypothetical protein
VLEYRFPYGRSSVPALDAHRAIRTFRSNAAAWQVAGTTRSVENRDHGLSRKRTRTGNGQGHFDLGNQDAVDFVDRASCRPDFVVLACSPKLCTTQSKIGILYCTTVHIYCTYIQYSRHYCTISMYITYSGLLPREKNVCPKVDYIVNSVPGLMSQGFFKGRIKFNILLQISNLSEYCNRNSCCLCRKRYEPQANSVIASSKIASESVFLGIPDTSCSH